MEINQTFAVFCASRLPKDTKIIDDVRLLGTLMAQNNVGMIYGGGSKGLMGAIADAMLAHDGYVTGVIPDFLLGKEGDRQDLSEKIVLSCLSERKKLIATRADSYVILPGGAGTLDELAEVWVWSYLKMLEKPIYILNTGGYFNNLLKFVDDMNKQGLFPVEGGADLLLVYDNPHDLIADALKEKVYEQVV